LLGVEAPADATLEATGLSFHELLPWWLTVLLLLLAAAGIVFLYTWERARLGIFRLTVLALLRSAAVVLVVLLLFRPVLHTEFHGERPRGVPLLLDDSLSLKQQDKRLSVADRLRVAIVKGLLPPDTHVTDSVKLDALPAADLTDPPRADLVRAALT